MTKLSSLSLLGFKLLFHPGQTQTLPLLATPENSFAPTDSISKCPLLVSSASCLLASFKYFSPALSFAPPPQANSETSTCQYQDRQTVDKEKSNQLMSIKATCIYLFPFSTQQNCQFRSKTGSNIFIFFMFLFCRWSNTRIKIPWIGDFTNLPTKTVTAKPRKQVHA